MVMNTAALFGEVHEYPDSEAARRLQALVGLDPVREHVLAEAVALLDPAALKDWSKRNHGRVLPVVDAMAERPALLIFGGDVGTGKTELAEVIGDPIARELGVQVRLYSMSLSTRGHGAVGEMTTLLTAAFDKVSNEAAGGRDSKGRVRSASLLLIDEADALAQSRELSQMHHEDRAGVNALIRGIDGLRKRRLPVLTIMCTNRVAALDPAVRRRAAREFVFARPGEEERKELLRRLLDGVKLSQKELTTLVTLTGPANGRAYGCTYSDIRQRFVPEAVLDAYRKGPITPQRLIKLAEGFNPTPPFSNGDHP